MDYPTELKYTPDHAWVRLEGNIATVGISDFAQEQLSDIVYVEVETEGESLGKDQVFGTIEAVKTLSDLFMPLSGEIIAFNKELVRKPEQINKTPYESWIIQIKPTALTELEELLSAEKYVSMIND